MESVSEIQETEVVPRPKRRRFSAKEKLSVLNQVEACKGETGAVGALLRREGLYSSHLTEWRRARDAGELNGLEPKKRGRKAREVNPLEKEIVELKQTLARAEARAKRAEALVELQKKISELLGIPPQQKDEAL